MITIERVRPILLSAPYGDPESSMENLLHLPRGLRTAGFVEITLSDGTVGLGEGYLAVFAPKVFLSIVELLAPLLVGRDARNLDERFREIVTATGYWSFQGAARHVLSAVEIALQDCAARLAGVPVWRSLGGTVNRPLEVYASGGDSICPESMDAEILRVASLGITTFKIRGRAHEVDKVAWTQTAGAANGIGIAVDMTQNLAIPSQTTADVLRFTAEVLEASGLAPVFLEEVLGPDRIQELPALRAESTIPIAGGEIVTTESELMERVRKGSYDIVQPDATVIGGLRPVMDVFDVAKTNGTRVYVHCWGAAVGVLANYHAALAGEGEMIEWPLPKYALREALLEPIITVLDGQVTLPDSPGFGVEITPDHEREFEFREDAVYDCLVDPARFPDAVKWE